MTRIQKKEVFTNPLMTAMFPTLLPPIPGVFPDFSWSAILLGEMKEKRAKTLCPRLGLEVPAIKLLDVGDQAMLHMFERYFVQRSKPQK